MSTADKRVTVTCFILRTSPDIAIPGCENFFYVPCTNLTISLFLDAAAAKTIKELCIHGTNIERLFGRISNPECHVINGSCFYLRRVSVE